MQHTENLDTLFYFCFCKKLPIFVKQVEICKTIFFLESMENVSEMHFLVFQPYSKIHCTSNSTDIGIQKNFIDSQF